MKKKILSIAAIALALTVLLITPAAALSDTPYQGYIYDSYDKSNPAPVGYEPEKVVNQNVLGLSSIGRLYDMDFDKEGNLYVLDSDNSSIYVLDVNLQLKSTLTLNQDGEPVNFSKAQGIYIHKTGDEKLIYIADTEQGRILVSDKDGNVVNVFTRPETSLIPESTEFRPTKVVVSDEETVYILCQHVYSGVLMLNQYGEFLGFCGSNKIEMTATVLFNYMWKKLLSEDLKTSQSRYVPVEYSGLDIDEEGYLLACSVSGTDKTESIRRLNAKGNNIFPLETVFGDLETSEVGENVVSTTFTDVTSIGEGVFAALDLALGRVFVYDTEGSFLLSFGTLGNQVGTFKTPVAIASYSDYVYVLDQATNTITMFTVNDYGKTVLDASRSYLKGLYNESIDLWESVLVQNGAFETAYVSIGRSLINLEDYKGAMKYFKLGQSRVDYSRAFQEYRTRLISEWFDVIFIAIIVIAVGLFIFFKFRKKKKIGYDYEVPDGYFRRLMLSLAHPVRDMMAFVNNTKGSFWIAPFVAALWFFEKVFTYQMRGFIFNVNDPAKMDIRLLFIGSVGLFVLFILSNWLICTMFSLSGKLSQIATVTSLAILPYIVSSILNTILSNFLTDEEGMFMTIITVLAIAWGVMILFIGLSKIHEANIVLTLVLVLATLLGIFVIVFLVLVFFSLWQQFIDFCTAVIREIIGILR
ncbi:MAG: hypothetical protein IJD00_03505 [Clostridia bacterium]|nr:hypothetical protein [Clostridia bacterium]